MNGTYDAFVHDRLTGTTTRVSVEDGLESTQATISGDGAWMAWRATGDQGVGTDTNGVDDIYVLPTP